MKTLAIGMALALLATLAPVSASSPVQGRGLAIAVQGCAAQEGGDEEGHCKLVFDDSCCADGPCMFGFTLKTEE